MKVSVIGFGSIGQRHTALLRMLNCDVSVVSKREIDYNNAYMDINECLQTENPEYIVIANKTAEHYEILKILVEKNYKGKILVEKPVFEKSYNYFEKDLFSQIFVAYNLRFHPLLLKLKNVLKESDLVSVNIYVGQYLPSWRPATDYKKGYSAKRREGGGVLRDLSHELDYLQWLFGEWKCLTAIGGHFSSLEIDTEDVVSIVLETTRCKVVSLHMNYLDRMARREIIVNTTEATITVDLIKNCMFINSKYEKIDMERNYTYQMQHQAVLNSESENLCGLGDGVKTVKMIEAIERAIRTKEWVEND